MKTMVYTPDDRVVDVVWPMWRLAQAAGMPQATVLFLFIAQHPTGCRLSHQEMADQLGIPMTDLLREIGRLSAGDKIVSLMVPGSDGRHVRHFLPRLQAESHDPSIFSPR